MAISIKSKIVLKYLEEDNSLPSLTLAKLIYKENPLDFKNVEEIRSCIRGYRGQSGQPKRDGIKNNKFYKEVGSKTPFKIPEPISKDYEPIILDKKFNNIGILSDFHIPNHRVEPIEVAVNYLKEKKVNCIILNGDVLDNTPFTRHGGERPTPQQVVEWFNMTELFFEWLRDEFPEAEIIWTEGNHDFWYSRWMMEHAHQLSKDPYFSLQQRLNIDEYKIKFIPQATFLKAGRLNIMHGHQLSGKFGVGAAPARAVFAKAKKSVIIGHVHVADNYTDNNLDREVSTCWTTGCLCTLTPDYNPIGGKACHGFAHAIIEDNGDFKVDNIRIHKGVIL